jgi:hypothetical protein
MSISVKIDKKFSNLGTDKINRAKAQFYAQVANDLPKVIVDNILKGISPVEGFGRFQQYSASYIKQIEHNRIADKKNNKAADKALSKGLTPIDKRNHGTAELFRGKLKSPVNLKLSGFMLASIKGEVNQNGAKISFDSPIAKYHNGDGKVYRPMLPKGGQVFSSLIMKKLKDMLKNALKP